MANYDVESDKHPWYRKMISFWNPTLVRPATKEEALLPGGKKRPRSLRSLGLASLESVVYLWYVPVSSIQEVFSFHSKLIFGSNSNLYTALCIYEAARFQVSVTCHFVFIFYLSQQNGGEKETTHSRDRSGDRSLRRAVLDAC